MKHSIGSYPRVRVQDDGRAVASQAGTVLLVETARKTGLGQVISAALAPWRKPRAVHDPGKGRCYVGCPGGMIFGLVMVEGDRPWTVRRRTGGTGIRSG
ncbi:hypothetical protein GCM10010398_64660 [Streptomyces fimbriatus]